MMLKFNDAVAERLQARREGEKGFTLIELLVVVIIIGVLAAIAIPVFLNQRAAAWRGTVESDLRNAAIAIQTEATRENGSYEFLVTGFDLGTIGFESSNDVTITIERAGTAESYALRGTHAQLTDAAEFAVFDSDEGGLLPWGNATPPTTP